MASHSPAPRPELDDVGAIGLEAVDRDLVFLLVRMADPSVTQRGHYHHAMQYIGHYAPAHAENKQVPNWQEPPAVPVTLRLRRTNVRR